MTDENLGVWRHMARDAEAGELALDPEVGNALVKDCKDYLDKLAEMHDLTTQVSVITGFGGFASSKDLERKFSLKGSGGPDSIDKRLREYADEVKLMQHVFEKSMANYHVADDSAAQRLSGIEGSM